MAPAVKAEISTQHSPDNCLFLANKDLLYKKKKGGNQSPKQWVHLETHPSGHKGPSSRNGCHEWIFVDTIKINDILVAFGEMFRGNTFGYLLRGLSFILKSAFQHEFRLHLDASNCEWFCQQEITWNSRKSLLTVDRKWMLGSEFQPIEQKHLTVESCC